MLRYFTGSRAFRIASHASGTHLLNLADSKRLEKSRVRTFPRKSPKVLISDRQFIVTTSFNWLSFRGDPNRTFRDEQGMFVGVRDVIDKRFDHLAPRFAVSGD